MKKTQTTLASLAMAMAMLPNAATAQIPQLNGMVVSSNNETRTGLWSLPKEQGGEWT